MRVITFGELMLRLAPEGYERFVQADRLTATLARAGKIFLRGSERCQSTHSRRFALCEKHTVCRKRRKRAY